MGDMGRCPEQQQKVVGQELENKIHLVSQLSPEQISYYLYACAM